MCTVSEPEYEDSALCMEKKQSFSLVGATCKKCSTQKADVVLRVKDAYCRTCFLSSVTHKFRGTLGKSRILRGSENVLIGVSGSQKSFALLNLVKEGLEMTSHKRLQCTPLAVYIDEGAILGQTLDERHAVNTMMSRLLRSYGFPAFISKLDRSLANSEDLYNALEESTTYHLNETEDLALQTFFEQVKNLSAKEDLLQKLRNKLLVMIAHKLNCSKVFIGDTSTDLAVKIMANLALGRGAQLPLDVGFCDSRYEHVRILRPLRDSSRKEVAMYNHFNNIESLCIPSLSTKADPNSSIQKLTEKFVVDLQNDFPSTVSTVFRTGDKLSLEAAGNSHDETCVLCQATLDTSYQLSSSLQATNFSHIVSSLGPAKFNSLKEVDLENATVDLGETCSSSSETSCAQCNCKSKDEKLSVSQVLNWLCYGCRLIVRDMESADSLPDEVLLAVKDRNIQRHMREKIKDFLL